MDSTDQKLKRCEELLLTALENNRALRSEFTRKLSEVERKLAEVERKLEEVEKLSGRKRRWFR